MTLLVAWVVDPLVMSALSLGCGLLLEPVAGRRLPGALLLPAGFATVVVVSSLTTMSGVTAPATTPLVAALAVAGAGFALPLRRRIDGWALAAALGAFAVYAAPIVLSGAATFAGYITLDDTATWLTLTDNVITHGRDISGLAPSTYQTVLNDLVPAGYPLGAYVPLGIGRQLTRQDPAWLFQPQIAFMAGMLGLAIYACTERVIGSRALRTVAGFLGAQAALLYGWGLWSGIKEVTVAVLVALIAGLVASLPGRETGARDMLPIAIAAAAVLDAISVIGGIWFVAFFVVGPLLIRATGLRRARAPAAGLAVATVVLALPALAVARAYFWTAENGDITSSGPGGLANLIHPLSILQVFGIWPAGDFRLRPQAIAVTYLLVAVVVLAGAAGLVDAVRRRAWGMPLYLAVAGAGGFAVVALGELGHGSPWLNAKALATASPAFVAAGVAGGAIVFERSRFSAVGLAGVALIATGVVWSSALAYANVWLAPRTQLSELETIGKRFAGEGPALMTEYQPYGVRHFLRSLDAEGASERRARPVQLRDGSMLGKGAYADIDAFDLQAILVYRTLVLRGSPVASRPPSVFQPVWTGRYYEVWQRPVGQSTILEHLSLGVDPQPAAVPACADVKRLAALAGQNGGALVAAERAPVVIATFNGAALPGNWTLQPDGTVVPHGAGTATVQVTVPAAGIYGVWLGGSFRGTVAIAVDGSPAGSRSDQLSESGQVVPFSSVPLTAGTHTVTVTYSRSRLRPGTGSYQFAFGPLELGEPATTARLVQVTPADATSLCGRSLDWIEAVG